MKTDQIRFYGCGRMVTGLVIALMVSGASTAGAQFVSTWDTTGGAFNVGSNWVDDLLPGPDDTAMFDNPDTFTVHGFGSGITNTHGVIGYSPAGNGLNVTFNLEEHRPGR